MFQLWILLFVKKKKRKKARMSEQALSIIKILECIEGNGHTVHCLKIS